MREFKTDSEFIDHVEDFFDHYSGLPEKFRTRLIALARRSVTASAALHRIGRPRARIAYCRDGHEEAVLIARSAISAVDVAK